MQLVIAYELDPAGSNMAYIISQNMKQEHGIFRSKYFDLVEILTPAISADWLEQKYDYDGYIFLSKHASESGTLALTCHSTGNFSDANYGGNKKQIAIPHPHLQKTYIRSLWQKRNEFSSFQITIEATHHGPTALNKPALFIEIGTTEKEWKNKKLCQSVANIAVEAISKNGKKYPVAICFGGTHYPEKFTKELIDGEFALGTVAPKHALEFLDEELFSHILQRNREAKFALLDWNGLGKHKEKVVSFIENTDLEMIKL